MSTEPEKLSARKKTQAKARKPKSMMHKVLGLENGSVAKSQNTSTEREKTKREHNGWLHTEISALLTQKTIDPTI